MQRRIIINKGKKYIVNVVGWEDGVWDEDPYHNLLYFSGSTKTIANPSGSIDESANSWKEVHGHSCFQLTGLDISDNLLITADLHDNYALTTLDCSSNALTTLDINYNSALATLVATGNALSSISIVGTYALLDVNLANNKLTKPCVDNILATLITNGLHYGTLDLTGGTNSPPTDMVDVIKLRNKDWLVNVN